MEVEGASNHKVMVLIYEILGTAFLIYAILVSNGNAIAVAFTVFSIILVLGPITGAHMNPAVTIGVYVAGGRYAKDLGFMLLIVVAECLGGFLGIGMSVASLYTQGLRNGLVLPEWVPPLCPMGIEPNTMLVE